MPVCHLNQNFVGIIYRVLINLSLFSFDPTVLIIFFCRLSYERHSNMQQNYGEMQN